MVDMRDKSKQYYVRGTFTRENTDFFEDVIHLADLGFKEISIEPVVLPDEHNFHLREEDLPIIFEQYDKLYEKCFKDIRMVMNLNFIILILICKVDLVFIREYLVVELVMNM